MRTSVAKQVMKNVSTRGFTGVAVAVCALSVTCLAGSAGARSHAPGQYLVPPPPPTPVLTVPPPPVMLPYSYALQSAPNAKSFASLPVPVAVRSNPAPTPTPPSRPMGRWQAATELLSLSVAKARGFGSPRGQSAASVSGTAGGAQASSYYANSGYGSFSNSNQSSPAWFDPSLRWYQNYQNARGFYNSLAQGGGTGDLSGYGNEVAAAPHSKPVHHSGGRHYRHSRRVIASR